MTVSTGPNAASAASNPAMMSASRATSIWTAAAAGPISPANAASRSARRAPSATFAPLAERMRPNRVPSPEDAPVMSAVRPVRSKEKLMAAYLAAGSSPFTYFISVVWKCRTRLS